MRKILVILVLTGLVTLSVSAQFVGDGASKPAAAPASMGKPTFFIKFGAAMPRANYGITPNRTGTPQFPSGIMGAKTGFMVESGLGMTLTNPEKKVGFYYYPLAATYWQTSLDWSSLGGFFEDEAIYTKPLRVFEIAQRYGISVKPMDDLTIALYYRPALLMPFKYEIVHESLPAGESFLFSGEMSTGEEAPIFMMSHTPGLSVRYMMASLSIEAYSAKPTYDVTYVDVQRAVNITSMGKIPVKLLIVSLALDF